MVQIQSARPNFIYSSNNMFTTSMIFVIVITFFMGLYLGGERQKRKFLIRNVQIQSERNNKSFRFNHKKENVERLYSQSIEAEKRVRCGSAKPITSVRI